MTEQFKESCKQCPSWYKCNLDSICYIAAATRQKCQSCTDNNICPQKTTYGRVRCHEFRKAPDLSKIPDDFLLYLASGREHSRGGCPFEKMDDAELQKQYEENVSLFKAGLIHQDFVLNPQQIKDNKIAEYGKPMDILNNNDTDKCINCTQQYCRGFNNVYILEALRRGIGDKIV